MNPFHLNGCSISDPVRDRIAGLGFPLEIPKTIWSEDWRAWWDRCQDQITDDQRAAVWRALGDAPPFEVNEVETEE